MQCVYHLICLYSPFSQPYRTMKPTIVHRPYKMPIFSRLVHVIPTHKSKNASHIFMTVYLPVTILLYTLDIHLPVSMHYHTACKQDVYFHIPFNTHDQANSQYYIIHHIIYSPILSVPLYL